MSQFDSNSSATENTKIIVPNPFEYGLAILAGVLLPFAALFAELGWAFSAEYFLNPIPTLWHVLLVGFVPAGNVYLLWCLYRNNLDRPKVLAYSSSLIIGVSIFYSLVFLPVSPISLIGIIVYGLGFLGLSPMGAFLCTFLIRRRLREVVGENSFSLNWKGAIVGLLLAVIIIGISESRFIFTRYALEMASSEDAGSQEAGLNLLRSYGDEKYLVKLSSSYKSSFYISDSIYGMFVRSESTSTEKAREIYYRWHGERYERAGDPDAWLSTPRDLRGNTNWRWRENKDLSMIESEMEGSIDNRASVGYLEWRMKFKNVSDFRQAEAVGQIQLPPDAVVSRLTLWVKGEEREAAFAERNKVTEAYEEIVSQSRDPVLVTSAGRDRVDMKCFPVLPKSGEMQIRIGITFPLTLEAREKGVLRLPYFRDNNFMIPDEFRHKVSVLATNELQTKTDTLESKRDKKFYILSGEISNQTLRDSNSLIVAKRDEENRVVRAKFENGYIKQEIREAETKKPSKYIFVVDTSSRMEAQREHLISAIEKLSKNAEVGLILTHGNAFNKGRAYPGTFTGTSSEVVKQIEQAEFGGGTDNLPSIAKAWDMANETENAVIVWIHSIQPFKFNNSIELSKRLVRRPNRTEIFSIPVDDGVDEIEKELADLGFLGNPVRFGHFRADLNRLISQLNRTSKKFEYVRTIEDKTSVTVDKTVSKHLARLWAYDEINTILASEKEERPAIDLAVKYQLVTPVTGAVVLETKEQYDKAGLKPLEKNVVHAVPEPETYFMLFVGFAIVLLVIRRAG